MVEQHLIKQILEPVQVNPNGLIKVGYTEFYLQFLQFLNTLVRVSILTTNYSKAPYIYIYIYCFALDKHIHDDND